MGLLNSALQIGRSAILGYQGALQVVGNNISSAASPDYTRLTPQLDPLQGNELTRGLQPGAGVSLSDIQRHLDEALESRVRLAVSADQAASTRQATLGQVEALFDDVSGSGVGARLREFLSALDELQNAPEDRAVRDFVLANGALLSDSLRTTRKQLVELGEAADTQITDLVAEANVLVEGIAELNERITRAEAGGTGIATGLRDQRDALLRRLSESFDVTSLEQPDGAINVYIGSEALAQGSASRRLVAATVIGAPSASAGARALALPAPMNGEFRRTSVRFADTNSEVPVRGGRLEGLSKARDIDTYGRVADLDQLASAMIQEVNRIHADGQGLVGFTSVTGAFDVLDKQAPLQASEAGLPFSPDDGVFALSVLDDATGTVVAHELPIAFQATASPTTLESLVAEINTQVNGVTASVTPDRRLSIVADEGSSFIFGYDGQETRADTANVLAALGVNTFFSGSDARDIAVNPDLIADPRRIAAAAAMHPGDGVNAGRIAALDSQPLGILDGATLPGFYTALTGSVAVATAAGHDNAESTDTILTSLQAQKESISGVSLDEEAIALLKYERAFQGASRFISVVDGLLDELVTLIR